ncbi:hypothetical protein [Nocardia sp. NPDC050413]|uniref:hypothetical protein n=1 Tax=Nocardia sp. NPDC050413 TaxID=3155784 RepID=UPI0033F67F3C
MSREMILLIVFSSIAAAYAFKSVQHLWAARTGDQPDNAPAMGVSDSDLGQVKAGHRSSAMWSIAVCSLNLPWVAYLAYVTRENDDVALPVLVAMAIYIIILNAIAQLGFKLIEGR